jgi:hypothetical protein
LLEQGAIAGIAGLLEVTQDACALKAEVFDLLIDVGLEALAGVTFGACFLLVLNVL